MGRFCTKGVDAMNIRTLALVFGSALTVAVGGIGAAACSSSSSGSGGSGSSGGGSSGGGADGTASSSGGSSGGGSSGSSSGSSSGGTSDAGTGTECGSIPALHQDEAGSIFCGYDDAGTSFSCTPGQQCCLGGEINSVFAPQVCATFGSDCTNGGNPDAGTGNFVAVPIACNQIADCIANGNANATACCLQGAKAPTPVTGCGYDKSTNGSAIVCEGTAGGAATPCAAGEIQICSSQADCPTGTTCTAGKWKLYQLGFCL